MINKYMNNDKSANGSTADKSKNTNGIVDSAGITMSSHLLIRDKGSNQELVNKRAQ
jgi:hypothetical protein